MKRFQIFLCLLFVFFSSAFAIFPTQIHIRGQFGKAKIDKAEKSIFIPVHYFENNRVYPLSNAIVEIFTLNKKITHTLPDTLDLRDWTFFKIGKDTWKIKGGYQLPNSDFKHWHTEEVQGFATFGKLKCSEMVGKKETRRIWDNGNSAFATSGSKSWPTYKIKLKDGSFAAELKTKSVFGIIASGNLFTGRIPRNKTLKQILYYTDKDGKDLIHWGIPFEGRPSGFRIKFKYDGKGDSCTIMATLENRKNNERRFIASAWYSAKNDSDKTIPGTVSISEPDADGLRTLEVQFIYGKIHPIADPFPKGVVQGNANEDITHINVVLASSRRGDFFKGVKGATLVVSQFELIY